MPLNAWFPPVTEHATTVTTPHGQLHSDATCPYTPFNPSTHAEYWWCSTLPRIEVKAVYDTHRDWTTRRLCTASAMIIWMPYYEYFCYQWKGTVTFRERLEKLLYHTLAHDSHVCCRLWHVQLVFSRGNRQCPCLQTPLPGQDTCDLNSQTLQCVWCMKGSACRWWGVWKTGTVHFQQLHWGHVWKGVVYNTAQYSIQVHSPLQQHDTNTGQQPIWHITAYLWK